MLDQVPRTHPTPRRRQALSVGLIAVLTLLGFVIGLVMHHPIVVALIGLLVGCAVGAVASSERVRCSRTRLG